MNQLLIKVTSEEVMAARLEAELRRRLGLPVGERLEQLAEVSLPSREKIIDLRGEAKDHTASRTVHQPEGRGYEPPSLI